MTTIKKIRRKDDKHVLFLKKIIDDKSSIIFHNALYQKENDMVMLQKIRWKDKFSHRMISYELYKMHKCHPRANT